MENEFKDKAQLRFESMVVELELGLKEKHGENIETKPNFYELLSEELGKKIVNLLKENESLAQQIGRLLKK